MVPFSRLKTIGKYKFLSILVSVVVGIFAFPTVVLGGTFVSSLIQGKTVEEAVQILATQIDAVIGRVATAEAELEEQGQTLEEQEQIIADHKSAINEQQETIKGQKELIEGQQQLVEQLKTTQQAQRAQLENEKACREADKLFFLLPPKSDAGRFIGPSNIVELYNETADHGDPRDLPIVNQYYQNYLSAKAKCE